MRVSEKWGGNVDEAVELALKDLKLTIDQVDVEVLEEPSKGFLGIGSKLAKVRVIEKTAEPAHEKRRNEKDTFDNIDAILASLPENQTVEVPEEIREEYDKFEQEEMEDALARESVRKKDNKPSQKKRSRNNRNNRRKNTNYQSMMMAEIKDLEPCEEHPAKDFLEEITREMGVDLDFSVKTGKNIVYVDISGKDTGTIIGKRGQTLDAIQYLCSIVVNKESDEYTRVILDAENYRAKRERTLVNLANRLAGKVERTKKSITLEPMNPYERKVIHSTLQDNPKVKTKSEGKDPYRRVIIERK